MSTGTPLDLFAPIGFAALVWWTGAGLVLLTERAVPLRGGARFLVGALGLGAACWAVNASLENTTISGAYLAFAAGVGVWAWHELAFISGWLTGPRRSWCPPDARGWPRFRMAAQTLIHHEIALAATLAALVWASWDAPNRTAVAAFAVLWVMRLSAKLNLFLGVPNLAAGALPANLAHMSSYFRRGPVNMLFPASVGLATAGAGAIATIGVLVGVETAQGVAMMLVATLLALAALEHWFMVLPLSDTLLWRWAFGEAADPRNAADMIERNARERAAPNQ